ncbi:unnamed protein product, partial [Polarella glacialis]
VTDAEIQGVNARTRAGVLCFRAVAGAAEGGADAFEFLLVSRRSRMDTEGFTKVDKYTIPAGKFEKTDCSYEDCASREALEEAGVECELIQDLGWHSSRSNKTNELIQSRYFLGRLVRANECWQEDSTRERCWFKPSDALQKVSYRADLADVITQGLQILSGTSFGVQQDAEQAACSNLGTTTITSTTVSELQQDAGQADRVSELRPKLSILLPHTEKKPDEDEQLWSPQSWTRATSETEGPGTSERYMCYSHQVGGHFCMVKPVPGSCLEVELPLRKYRKQLSGILNDDFGMVIDSDLKAARSGDNGIVHGSRVILKPLDATEERFYRQLPDGLLAPLQQFTPLFYGTKKLRSEQIENLAAKVQSKRSEEVLNDQQQQEQPVNSKVNSDQQNVRRYVVLEDLASGASRPCFLDLKVGCRQRAARYGLFKREHMAAKAAHSTSAALGFRICGMTCFDPNTKATKRYDKYWGQKVSVESMGQALAMFFPSGTSDSSTQPMQGVWRSVLKTTIEKLGKLETTLQQLPGMRFWGSSLLVVFDAGLVEGEASEEALLRSVRLKIIDFANFEHVGGDCADEEYLCGVRNIRVHLEAILHGLGSASEEWIRSRLSAPPPAELQDADEERVWQARKNESSRSPRAARKSSTNNISNNSNNINNTMTPDEDSNLPRSPSGAHTISGATGRQLLRELSSHHIILPAGSRPGGGDLKAVQDLDDLFS